MALFAYVVMNATKSILPETETFPDKLIHHEERAKSSPDNLSNFNNPPFSNIEELNDTFNFKEAIIQPDRLGFLESMIKDIDAHE